MRRALSSITKHLADGQTAVTEMLYDTEGNLSWKRGPDGQEVSYSYVEGQLESMTTASGTWTYAYDDEGRMTTVSDPFGNTRGREYDADGNVTAVTVNGQIVGTYSYAGEGVLRERTDAAGNVYRFGHNEDGQLTWQQDPENRLLWYEYDAQGRLWKTTDGSGNAIIREYGVVSDGSSSSCTSCSGGLFSRSDEGVERLQKIIYPTFTKEFRYDAEGRVSEELYVPDGGGSYSVSYSYDQFGRLQSTTGPDGKTSTTHYDLLGRKIAVTGDTGHVAFEYDNWDNLTSLSDAKGQITEFVYDNSGRLTQELRPMQQSTGYEYDDQGRLQKILDAKNQTTDYGYDSQGRIETISYDDGRSVTLSYDTNGNLAGYDDGVTSASYTYDAVGRKLSETVNYGTFTKSFSYTYYSNGLKQSFTAPDGTMYEYAYGSNNELREVRIPGLGSMTISEYQWNRPKTMRYPGGSEREYEYDALMRLTRILVKDPGGNSILDYSYEYDSRGNIVSKSTGHGTYSYGYDGASRLTSVDNPTLEDESYSYDAVGNRVTASNAPGTVSHNTNNELLVYGDVEYVYDANGNMIQKTLGDVAVNYIYNAENRLVKVEDELIGLVIAEYFYDPFGRRLWKEVAGVRTYFFYSDEGLMAEYGPGGTELRSYGYQPDSTWTTDPLFLRSGGQYFFYQNDHLGTPQKLIAVNGAVVWSAQYTAFGDAQIQVETVTNNLRFPGQYYDAETGLHYNFQRYYKPEIGRYLNKDPIEFAGGSLNFYGYAENNSINIFDPHGLDVYVAQRRLDLFINFDIANWLDPYFPSLPASKAGRLKVLNFLVPNFWADDTRELLAVFNWYAQRTRHCSVFILTECDQQLLQQYTDDDDLTIENLWAINFLKDIQGEYSGDFNAAGINIPAADIQQRPFPIEKYRRDAEIVNVIDSHKYDDLIKDSIKWHYAFPIQYKISNENRYNCCDWAEDVINTAMDKEFISPNPTPFGDRLGAPIVVSVYQNSFFPEFLLAEEYLQRVFDSPRANTIITTYLDLSCDSACVERYANTTGAQIHRSRWYP